MTRHCPAECLTCLLQLRQFWRPSAWADALGFYTGYKRWLAACYPLVVAAFVWASLKRLQIEIRDRCLEELFWSGARLDLWVLALYLLLSFPIASWLSVRYNAADGTGTPENRLRGDRKKMVELLRQTLEAGSALSNYLMGIGAQGQQSSFESFEVDTLPAMGGQAQKQGGSASENLLPDMLTLISGSMHDVGLPDSPTSASASMHETEINDEEAYAAYDQHLTIVRNLTARLSQSARILYGAILTEPWEGLEAFRQ